MLSTVLSIMPREASAYQLSKFKWCGVTSKEFYYGFINKKKFKREVKKALDFWNKTLREKTVANFKYIPLSQKRGKESGDGINGMYWDKSLGYATLAVTSTLYYPAYTSDCGAEYGEVEETDIAFNAKTDFTLSLKKARKASYKTYFWFVVIHELGHSLGLEHSSNPKSVMTATYHLQRKLGLDDINAIRKVYGTKQ